MLAREVTVERAEAELLPESSTKPQTLQHAERLSRSVLWGMQRRYFDEAGIEAWRTSTVPHYVTNNPALAYAYASVFFGWLRDFVASGQHAAQPVTIVELGAGSGRFACLFLDALRSLLRRSSLSSLAIRYVMTDFTESNIQFWQTHPALQRHLDDGTLDFALFDAEQTSTIHLRRSGATLAPGALDAPLGVIANYVLDGIRQDAFCFVDGRLHEVLVSVLAGAEVSDVTDPELLGRMRVECQPRLAEPDYYGNAELDAAVHGSASSACGGTVLFPYSAIRCIEWLSRIAGGRLFLLSADRGAARCGADDLGLAVHGSFSATVDFQTIGGYFGNAGGSAWHHRSEHLDIMALLLGSSEAGSPETKLAFEESIVRAGPSDFFDLRRGLQCSYEHLSLAQSLSLLRLSRHDPKILIDLLPALWKHVGSALPGAAHDLVRELTRTWENYYFLAEETDFPFELGLLLHAFGAHREALSMFRASLRLRGDAARAHWNLGICHYALGEIDAALECFRRAAQVEPGFVPERSLQVPA